MGPRTASLLCTVSASALFASALPAGCAGSPEPAPSGWPAPPPGADGPTPPPDHVVAAGETACAVAGRYGVAPDALLRANGLAGPQGSAGAPLAAGTRLRVPDDAPLHHRVGAGETLAGLAAHYGVTVAELARVNGLADPDWLFAGANLRIPPGAANGCPPHVLTTSAPRPTNAPALAERLRPADALIAEARERYGAADFVGAIELAAAAAHRLDGLEAAPPVVRRRAQSAWIAAVSWAGLGRREEALERFERVLELDPALAEEEPVSPRLQALIDEARERRNRP